MWESEMDLEHACNSAVFIYDIRTILNSVSSDRAAWAQKVGSLVKRIDELLKQTPDEYVPAEWHVMIAGLHVLASQAACVAIALGGNGNLVEERARCEVLIDELRRLLLPDSLGLPDSTDSTRQSLLQTGQCDFEDLRSFLLKIPLPTLYWYRRKSEIPYQNPYQNRTEEPKAPPMVRVIVFLDHAPVASPQLLKPNILYSLKFQVRGLEWPDEAKCLRLDLLTTCPRSEYSVSEFALVRPRCIENGEYQGELPGNIKFKSAQSSGLDDLVFTVRGAFETSDGVFVEIPVIGHNELCLRVVNQDRYPLMTSNQRLDRHLHELVEKLRSDCPKVEDELPDLLRMLETLTNLLATYAQEAIFKKQSDVSESEFQGTVLSSLRMVLGQDIQEHPKQAGGVTDIRYRGVIVELKVEKKNGDRKHISKKYTAQAAQYAGVEARQVSILLVLDLTPKDKPPGDIRNDILLTDVETHGGDDTSKEFPSKAFVFVINGNMNSPSDYSR